MEAKFDRLANFEDMVGMLSLPDLSAFVIGEIYGTMARFSPAIAQVETIFNGSVELQAEFDKGYRLAMFNLPVEKPILPN